MGVWGQAPSINLAYYQKSKFGIAVDFEKLTCPDFRELYISNKI
jgi:hypothetical protein